MSITRIHKPVLLVFLCLFLFFPLYILMHYNIQNRGKGWLVHLLNKNQSVVTQHTVVLKRSHAEHGSNTTGGVSPDIGEYLDARIDKELISASCDSEQWVDMTHSFWGLMYVAHESRLDDTSLKTFLHPMGPVDTRIIKERDGIKHIRFLQQRNHQIKMFRSEKAVIMLPSWCSTWPYAQKECDWRKYTTALWNGSNLCFWPSIPQQEIAANQGSMDVPSRLLNTTLWTGRFSRDETRVQRVMVAGGFFGNFWHAAAIFNTWCTVRHQTDIHFLVQAEEIPPYVSRIVRALGIQSSRILRHTGPVVADSVLLAPYNDQVDWSCLHAVLQGASTQERNAIVVYYRNWDDPCRNIPKSIHQQLVSGLSLEFPEFRVETFSGEETFKKVQMLFQQARIVIGPHGAGMVNLIFCRAGTPVIEFTTDSLLDRPWQAMGAQTFGLQWWPVLLSNFSAGHEIMSAMSLVKKALQLS